MWNFPFIVTEKDVEQKEGGREERIPQKQSMNLVNITQQKAE